MNLSQRLQTAVREEGNIVALAGAAALSLALLNPIPLLVGMVAETVYLLYVPDSRWYANHLSTRYDNEVKKRRTRLKTERFATAPPETMQTWAMLEAMRQAISERTRDVPEWLVFLRRLDYLLELQIQTQGNAALIEEKIRHFTGADSDDVDAVSTGAERIAYFESTADALQNVIRDMPSTKSQTEVRANIAQVERQKSEMQKELFQIVAAQHLMETTDTLTSETSRLLTVVRDSQEANYLSWWGEDALRITKDAETNLHRLEDWLKQAK